MPRTWSLPLVLDAAVAVLLRGSLADAEVLLVRRATRAGDPWSGDMAFPGGRRGPGDVDLIATATRETFEEVGARLDRRACRGALRPVPTLAPSRRSRLTPMLVTPIVFVVEDVTLTPNHEIAATRWVPLRAFRDPMASTIRPWRLLGFKLSAPAWKLGDDVVWGLTHLMLRRLFAALPRSP